jgi:hypothetical protein
VQIAEGEDFISYVLSKIKGVQKMISYKGMSKIEREAARKWIKKMLFLDQAKKNPNPSLGGGGDVGENF